jgi:hypothetical protein
MQKSDHRQSGTVVAGVRDAYEAKVVLEAFNRCGRNPNLKGVVHEVLARDLINSNPQNIVSGTKCVLTASPRALRDDLLLKQGAKVVGRMQLKDTAGSIRQTVRQTADHKYARTLLMGTKETAEAYAQEAAKTGLKVTQKMHSTGISSSDTARIANKVLGKVSSAQSLGTAAKGSGIAGAVLGAGIEAVTSAKELKEGKITPREYAGRVAKEGVKGGVTAAAATAASSFASAGAVAAVAGIAAAPVWVPVAIGVTASVAVGAVGKKLLDWLW